MTDQLLGFFKIVLLLALYLFFARVLWAVWNEVRVPAMQRISTSNAPSNTSIESGGSSAVKVRRPYRVSHMKVIAPSPLRGFTFIVDQPFTIGRSTDNDISIEDDQFASAHHARFTSIDGYTKIEDLASTNGTFINNKRIETISDLKIGDRAQVGTLIIEACK